MCQDWPGPRQWRNPIPPDFYFTGEDLAEDANLLGLIAFCFACHGAGTPLHDDFAQRMDKPRQNIAPFPFVAELPMKMLSHPRGGALAMVGHIERAWSCSFHWPDIGSHTVVFSSALKWLLEGYPIGAALEFFNQRYAALAVHLNQELEDIKFGKQFDPYELVDKYTATKDARNYAIIGDPAVRLPIA